VLEPILEKLAQESQGAFRLARLNVDENPNLSKHYQVRSIPAVKAFRDGKMVSEFIGVQPEPRIREFLRNLIPSENELLLAKGQSLIKLKDYQQAEAAFRQVLDSSPGDPAALLGYSRTLLFQGRSTESLDILDKFPASREYSSAEKLRPLAVALSRPDDLNDSDEHLINAYQNTIRLIKRGNLEAALDGLLDILRQDKHFQNGDAQRIILAIFELLGEEHPITRSYRIELASILF
jgi:putative thioredoxin